MGRIHSFQSLGTLDGPGLRSVIFMQGCPLRCVCCHNPDTWDLAGGELISSDELVERVLRYRSYFGEGGGVTVSGGEPLIQADFVADLFQKLKKYSIHTCLDTSGVLINGDVERLLSLTDLVMLDYKYVSPENYLKYTRCSLSQVRSFLSLLNERKINTWLRYVVIPNLNDSDSDIAALAHVKSEFSCITNVELLPFRKLCIEKYQALGIPFPLSDTPEADQDFIDAAYRRFFPELCEGN